MSNLTAVEKRRFEDLFGMSSGYVLDLNNPNFGSLFKDASGANIFDQKFTTYGDSKAKRLRSYWESEDDKNIGKILKALLEMWRYQNPKGKKPDDDVKHDDCLKTIDRLLSKGTLAEDNEDSFLKRDFGELSSKGLDLDAQLEGIIDKRIIEVKACLHAKAHLSAIFMCGSILEGVLLNAAAKNAQVFNQAKSSPKDATGKVKQFHNWSLAQFIDVSQECGLLRLDVKKFSHGLRDFRNYIHPFEQRTSGFDPDQHTAEICFQVLRAALAGLKEKASKCS